MSVRTPLDLYRWPLVSWMGDVSYLHGALKHNAVAPASRMSGT